MYYLRKKASKECYNGEEFDRVLKIDSCECSFTDYECDFNYYHKLDEQNNQNSECIPVKFNIKFNFGCLFFYLFIFMLLMIYKIDQQKFDRIEYNKRMY